MVLELLALPPYSPGFFQVYLYYVTTKIIPDSVSYNSTADPRVLQGRNAVTRGWIFSCIVPAELPSELAFD